MRILMVCLGNICRSPLAEGILAHKIKAQNLNWTVDSAGTGNWHVGSKPDSRSIAVAKEYGIDISNQRTRQIQQSDFSNFDLILVMDQSNYRNVINIAPNKAAEQKVAQILTYGIHTIDHVPDPYHDDNGFEQVYRLLDHAIDAVIETYTK
jgi:protein-tyrosine phosphatase